MNAALSASDAITLQIQEGQKGRPSELVVVASGGQIKASGTSKNVLGGSAEVLAQGTIDMGGNTSLTEIITFADWKDAKQDLVLNGKLTVNSTLTVTISGASTTSITTVKYGGDVKVSGSANGTAAFDLTVATTVGTSGACVRISGSVSGQVMSQMQGTGCNGSVSPPPSFSVSPPSTSPPPSFSVSPPSTSPPPSFSVSPPPTFSVGPPPASG